MLLVWQGFSILIKDRLRRGGAKPVIFVIKGWIAVARIVSVTPNDNHTLLIELDNNHRIIYDMRSRFHTTRFCKLADIKKFLAVRVEHENTLVWDNLCQITIDEIMDMIDR
jgi:hypothetical protein